MWIMFSQAQALKNQTKPSVAKVRQCPESKGLSLGYGTHEDRGEKPTADIAFCYYGGIHVFCEARALEQFYNEVV